ncbi:hypothetical protein [uncultured Chryseobacterium sp.]|uniref:hypothetical protein n=1 Tax=uncultured Chryseobacterium sp. TaxID=259322 RepID=UPI0025D5B46C|nr:hypothetical protein [uncultured Chryseobacterium sp.]
MNGVIIQFFHWYHPGNLWNEFSEKAEYLKELGITAVWLPPATKGNLGTEGRVMTFMIFMTWENLTRKVRLPQDTEANMNTLKILIELMKWELPFMLILY